VRGTPGAALDSRIEERAIDAVIDKGTERDAPGYSAFEATGLRELLEKEGIEHATITGLATEFCVKQTALDALRAGVAVTIATAAVRGIDEHDAARALEELAAAGAALSA
jgi:nicotinamidase/pyrazinamidase